MRLRILAAAAALAIAATGGPANAADVKTMIAKSEKLTLKGRKGSSLFSPGYQVGEYTGEARVRDFKFRALDISSKDSRKATVTISRPGMETLTASCAGGESYTGFIVTFDRDELEYVCSFERGGQPVRDMSFRLQLAKGRGLARLTMPQRAAELRMGRTVIRADTRGFGGLPTGMTSYLFTRDGVEVGGINKNAMAPSFYLPPPGSPDRDAAAIAAIIIFFFNDPSDPKND